MLEHMLVLVPICYPGVLHMYLSSALASLNRTGMIKGVTLFDDDAHYAVPNSCPNGAPKSA